MHAHGVRLRPRPSGAALRHRAVHQDGPGQSGHPLLRLPRATEPRLHRHGCSRHHHRPELPTARRRVHRRQRARQPGRVRRPRARDRRGRQLPVAGAAEQPRPTGDPRGLRRLVRAARHAVYLTIGHRGDRASAAEPRDDRKALQRSRKATGQPDQDLAAVSAVVLPGHPGQHHGRAAPDARWSGDAVLLGRALRAAARRGSRHHPAGDRRALPRLPARQPVVHLAGLHQPPDIVEQRSGSSGSGRHGPHRGRRPEPRRHQLGRNAGPSPWIPAVPLAAGVASAHRGRWAHRRARRTSTSSGRVPHHEHNKISEEDWRTRIALRQQQIAARMLG